MTRLRLRAKALRFGADDGDICGCPFPLEGVVAGPLPVSRFRVKTLVRSSGFDGDGALRRDPLNWGLRHGARVPPTRQALYILGTK